MSRALGDSRLYRVLQLVTDLVVINVLTVLGALPVVTAGASFTAGLACCMRMVQGEEGHVPSAWWQAFRRCLRHVTLTWVAAVLLTGLIAVEWIAAGYLASPLLAQLSMAIVMAVAVLIAITMAWYLPIAARDALRGPDAGLGAGRGVVRQALLRLRQALLVSVRLLPRTVGVVVVVWAPLIVGVSSPAIGARMLLFAVVILVAVVLYLVVLVVRKPLGLAIAPSDDDAAPTPGE